MTDAPSLAGILTAARLTLGWTIEQAAEETGLLPEYVEFAEAGQIRQPGLESLRRFAVAYGIDMGDLMIAAGHLPPRPLPPW